MTRRVYHGYHCDGARRKSEHLIYVILPSSVAIYFLVQWEITTLSLALASLFASFLALLLFEFSIDEIIVKTVFRRLSGEKYGFQRRRLLLWNIFLRSWESENTIFDAERDVKKLEKEISQISEAAVSSSLISSRMWRLRGELYFIISIIPLVMILSTILNELVLSSFMLTSTWFPIIQRLAGIFNDFGFLVILFLIIVLSIVVRYRHRNLSNDIRYLAQFRYLERKLALLNMSRDSQKSNYGYREETRAVWTEITLQNELLTTRDWSFFIDRTSRWGRQLSKQITDEIEEKAPFDLMEPWTRLADSKIEEDDKYWQKLCWMHYYFKKLVEYEETTPFDKDDDDYPQLDTHSKELIEHIGKKIETGRDYFTNPNEFLDLLVKTPHDSKPFLPIMQSIAFRPHLLPHATIEQALAELMRVFSKKQSSTYNQKKAAQAIIYIFKGVIPSEMSIWAEGDSPFTRLSNLIKAIGCGNDGFEAVVKNCIQNSPTSSLRKMQNDNEIHNCITKLGLQDALAKRIKGTKPAVMQGKPPNSTT